MRKRSGARDPRRIAPRLGERLTYANVTATLALFVAVGGGSFAVAALSGSEKRVVTKIAKKQISKRAPGLSVKHAGSADALTCKGPSAGQMVKVGSVCIDKYEASVWSQPNGGVQYGVNSDNYPCADSGQNCNAVIFARSVPGVTPSRFITWFQAQQALSNSGKRLPTSAEWQTAVVGTPDSTACNVGPGGSIANTGSFAGCLSNRGAFDMVGNLWEWVADWVPASTGSCPGWGSFSNDYMCLSGADTTEQGPGALIRGSSWNDTSAAGPFSVSGSNRPVNSVTDIGFRGAR